MDGSLLQQGTVWKPWVNFSNILCPPFTHADSKSTKNTVNLSVFLCFWDLRAEKLHIKCMWNWHLESIQHSILQAIQLVMLVAYANPQFQLLLFFFLGWSPFKSRTGVESIFCSSRFGQKDRTMVKVKIESTKRPSIQGHWSGKVSFK